MNPITKHLLKHGAKVAAASAGLLASAAVLRRVGVDHEQASSWMKQAEEAVKSPPFVVVGAELDGRPYAFDGDASGDVGSLFAKVFGADWRELAGRVVLKVELHSRLGAPTRHLRASLRPEGGIRLETV